MKRKKLSYGRTKAVRERLKHLDSLIECQYITYDELTRIQAQHTKLGVATMEEAETFLSAYPIETLKESCNFDSRKNMRFRLKDLHLRSKLRKQWDEKEEQLDKLDFAIYLAEIDLVLEKAKDLLKKAEQ